jgi:hypothetical protein
MLGERARPALARRRLADVEDPADVVELELLVPAQDEDRAHPLGQRVDRRGERRAHLVGLELGERTGPEVRGLGGSGVVVRAVEARGPAGLRVTLRAPQVADLVRRDREHPGPELARRVERRDRPLQVHEDVLRHVLGRRLVPDHPSHVPVDPLEIELVEAPERFPVARDQAREEDRIPLVGPVGAGRRSGPRRAREFCVRDRDGSSGVGSARDRNSPGASGMRSIAATYSAAPRSVEHGVVVPPAPSP